MVKNGQRLGDLLLEADVITKRQLAKAIQKQLQGDKSEVGQILIELGYISVEDLTDVMLESHAGEEVKEKVIKEKVVAQPIDISEDAVMKTKFALDVKTIISAAVGIASLVGMWYALQADIQEAKELPKIDNIYEQEYPSKPEGYNWPRSYEQYKENVEDLQETVDEVLDLLDEYEETIKELRNDIKSLERRKRDK